MAAQVGSRPVAEVQGARPGVKKWLGLSKKQIVVALGLGLIVALGAFLRFYKLGAYSVGNAYYAATVKSMLTSWHNFFFAAYEPGGSVTVDKPPLGFWVQAVSAYFLGVNGLALALPQALAGVLSIPLLYKLVKRPFGTWAGLAAALVLAVMPITVATERNNTVDGLLLFVLLLAAWAFLRATRRGRMRDLLLGVFLVGLGFNIKMLQAFMPLPAFYALYFLGAPHRWWKRVVHLAVASVLLLAVSLSWAIAVDLTPAENRPYIGSSENNTVLELIVGHNGLRRLGLDAVLAADGRDAAVGDAARRPIADAGPGQFPDNPPPPPNDAGQRSPSPGNPPPFGPAAGLQPGNPARPGPGGPSSEVGEAGVARLFSEPLATQASWLLPLALLGLPLALVVLGWRWPLSEGHLALVLWGTWLLAGVAYFSLTTGLFHTYYLIMLGPPLAALVGAAMWAIWQVFRRHAGAGWSALVLLVGITVVFQIVVLQNYPDSAGWITVSTLTLGLAGVAALALGARKTRAALGVVLAALLVAPAVWSAQTTFNTRPEVSLPRAGESNQPAGPTGDAAELSPEQQALLSYLLENTAPDSYLLAVSSSHQASPYILATGRPVLTFGGFNGGDDVISVEQLAQLVAGGEIRFVLDGGLQREKPEIAAWLTDQCRVVSLPGATDSGVVNGQTFGPGRPGAASVLYDCGHCEVSWQPHYRTLVGHRRTLIHADFFVWSGRYADYPIFVI